MKRLLVALLLLAGCDGTHSPGEIPPEATRGIPTWVAPNFVISPRSATEPRFSKPEIQFRLQRGNCSNWSDGRAPSDCATRTSRSVIASQSDYWQLGGRYLLSFEYWVDPAVATRPYRARGATQTDGITSRMSIFRVTGEGNPNHQLFDLKVDAVRGVTFLGETCIPPSEFGKWHRFDLRMRWAADDTGFLEIRCHGNLYRGAPIFARSDFPTTRALHCFPANNCVPGDRRTPRQPQIELGIIYDGLGPGGRGFAPIPASGVTVRFRRLVERRLWVIFNRVEEL